MDQDVQPAEAIGGLGDAAGGVLGLAHVGHDENGSTAEGFDPREGCPGFVVVMPSVDGHIGSRPGKFDRGGRANAFGPAGDQGALAFELHGGFPEKESIRECGTAAPGCVSAIVPHSRGRLCHNRCDPMVAARGGGVNHAGRGRQTGGLTHSDTS